MSADRVRVGVLGASGTAGGELVRLLLGHPGVDLAFLGGRDSAGRTVADVHPHLAATPAGPARIRPFEEVDALDVAFLALPRGESAGLAPTLLEDGIRVVDLGGDFRLPADAYPEWYGFEHPSPAWLGKAVYGLPERFRDRIRPADLVANPGCFPTPAVLGLAPLLEAGLLESGPIVVDGKTGLSGAGRGVSEAATHAASEESVRPYRFPAHQHTPEIELALAEAVGMRVPVTFVPHLVPAVRGVLVTCFARAAAGATTELLVGALSAAYATEPFVRVLAPGAMADTKRVRGSNVVELQAAVDPRTGTAVVIGALDNLVKGAAGQAIQNLNLLLGLEETTALPVVGLYP
jgi:N-acetyl-gamma-glutamyl-phosphate reductase